ncbi:MAG: hypothetical protein DME75_07070 [Verrucomicrobia bacterium]|nr:MAG: hypothetical protein DME75_07070 [Verrucomicrobiota bacterium]
MHRADELHHLVDFTRRKEAVGLIEIRFVFEVENVNCGISAICLNMDGVCSTVVSRRPFPYLLEVIVCYGCFDFVFAKTDD